MEGHSGYEFPWAVSRFIPLSCSTAFHEYHHRYNKGNYATFFIFWDTICGTNQNYYEEVCNKADTEDGKKEKKL